MDGSGASRPPSDGPVADCTFGVARRRSRYWGHAGDVHATGRLRDPGDARARGREARDVVERDADQRRDGDPGADPAAGDADARVRRPRRGADRADRRLPAHAAGRVDHAARRHRRGRTCRTRPGRASCAAARAGSMGVVPSTTSSMRRAVRSTRALARHHRWPTWRRPAGLDRWAVRPIAVGPNGSWRVDGAPDDYSCTSHVRVYVDRRSPHATPRPRPRPVPAARRGRRMLQRQEPRPGPTRRMARRRAPAAVASSEPSASAAPAAPGATAGTLEVEAFDLGFTPMDLTVDAPGRYEVKLDQHRHGHPRRHVPGRSHDRRRRRWRVRHGRGRRPRGRPRVHLLHPRATPRRA